MDSYKGSTELVEPNNEAFNSIEWIPLKYLESFINHVIDVAFQFHWMDSSVPGAYVAYLKRLPFNSIEWIQ